MAAFEWPELLSDIDQLYVHFVLLDVMIELDAKKVDRGRRTILDQNEDPSVKEGAAICKS
jgi:hypothetical protein